MGLYIVVLFVVGLFLQCSGTLGSEFVEIEKIVPAQVEAGDKFGFSVWITETYLIVGSPGDDEQAGDSGAVYVYIKNITGDSQWSLKEIVYQSDPTIGASFGDSVLLHNDNLFVGATGASVSAVKTGAVYLFQLNTGSDATFIKKLVPSLTVADASFGNDLAADGDNLVVGAFKTTDGITKCGTAYVFEENLGGTGNWGLVKRLVSSSKSKDSEFGNAVSIDGDFIAIGSHRHGDFFPEGAVDIFSRSQGGVENWGNVNFFDVDDFAWMGTSLSLQNGMLVVGEPAIESGSFDGAGLVSIYTLQNGVWQFDSKFAPSDSYDFQFFGNNLRLKDGMLLAQSHEDDESGAIYFFNYNTTTGKFDQKSKMVATDKSGSARFGDALDFDDAGFFASGAPQDSSNKGAVYVFGNPSFSLPTAYPTKNPTLSPSTSPTISPTTSPTLSPTTSPTSSPTTESPTLSPTTESPTVSPTTASPTTSPTTASPTTSPTSSAPTTSPTSSAPTTSPITPAPTTSKPTRSPTTPPEDDSQTKVFIVLGGVGCAVGLYVLSSLATFKRLKTKMTFIPFTTTKALSTDPASSPESEPYQHSML